MKPQDRLTLLLDGTDLAGLSRCEHIDFLECIAWLIPGALDGPTLARIAAPVDDRGGLDLA
ncbi:hypothetical protein ACSDR0_46165 [Streptosporangium sp. G11]|uniref:hypothetical protein n=1 Tax=Streptosporangium sp. G11 TaxID=3436926 RepID=UPI003EBC964B